MAKHILIISNLYPLPWDPSRATFNKQQFELLSQKFEVRILVPVAWPQYLRNFKALKKSNGPKLKYVCFWYTPKMFHSFFHHFMYISLKIGAKYWLRKQIPDLVYGSWVYPDGTAAAKLAKQFNVPFVLKVHGSDINLLADAGRRQRIIARTCKQAAQVVAVSNALKERVIELVQNRKGIACVYNGVNSELFYPENGGFTGPYLLFVGNLKKDKGVLDLLAAYRLYRRAGGGLSLKIIGAGALYFELKKRVAKFGLIDKVEICGAMRHAEVAQCLRYACGLSLPSYNEGVPNVLLEAAASGVPVLATAVGGIPEVVIPGVTGCLVEPGDIEGIARGLEELSKIEKWNRELIAAHGKKFSWERNIQKFTKIFQAALICYEHN